MRNDSAGKGVLYADYTWRELDRMSRSDVVLVLPSGSVEQHGGHLPLANDSIIANEVAVRAAQEVSGAFVLPCLWYTPCVDTANYTGTLSIGSSSFVAYVCDVFESLYRHGFRKLIIANGHGGAKTALDVAAREFHARMGTPEKAYDDDFFIHVHNIYTPATEYLNAICESRDWGHAGEMETSIEMYLWPQRVRTDRGVEEYIPWQSGFEWYIGDMSAVNESGVHGDPAKASPEKGEKVLKALVSALTDILRKMQAGPV